MPNDFARILHTGALPKLGSLISVAGGFNKWVTVGAYEPALSENGELLLKRIDIESFTRVVSFDYERFALAAQESRIVALSERENLGAVSWPLLKQYYSAFFSAHAIMRSRGAGIVNIGREQSNVLTSTLKSYLGPENKFSKGWYYFSISKGKQDAPGEVTITFTTSKDGSGAHEGFWKAFVQYLQVQAEQAVIEGLPDNQDFVSCALKIKSSIMSGESVWISKIRNEINYHHEHSSWMPISKKSISNMALPKLSKGYSSNARLDISRVKDPIKAFFCICCYMSELNLIIATRVAARSKAGGTFGQRWSKLIALTDGRL